MKLYHFLGAALAVLAIGCSIAMAAPDPAMLFPHGAGDLAMAMTFMPMAGAGQHALLNPHRTRGMIYARADATEATKIFNELRVAVEAMKSEHEKQLADLKKGMADVVQTEKVDRINAEITKLQAALDETNRLIAAARLGGGGDVSNPDKLAHATAFDRFFRRGADNGLRELEVKAALRTGSDPDGGYVVPEQVEMTINELLRTVSTVRSLASVLTISSDKYKKLFNMQGAGSGWVGEVQARPETNTPALSELEFPVFEIYANPAAAQGLLDDGAVDIGTWLANEVESVFADQEGDAFVNGTGVLKPRGILKYTTVANSSYAWGKLGYIASGAAADFATSDPADRLIDLVHALRAGYRQGARWLMNDLTIGKIRKIKDGTGNYIWQPSLTADAPSTLLGYGVSTDDNMPDVGAGAFAIAFGDFRRGYLIVDRQGIRVLRDPFTNKPYVHFYTTKRVGGGVQNFEAIKLMKIAAS